MGHGKSNFPQACGKNVFPRFPTQQPKLDGDKSPFRFKAKSQRGDQGNEACAGGLSPENSTTTHIKPAITSKAITKETAADSTTGNMSSSSFVQKILPHGQRRCQSYETRQVPFRFNAHGGRLLTCQRPVRGVMRGAVPAKSCPRCRNRKRRRWQAPRAPVTLSRRRPS